MLTPRRHHLVVALATAALTTIPAHAADAAQPVAVADQQRHSGAGATPGNPFLTSITDIFTCEDSTFPWCK